MDEKRLCCRSGRCSDPGIEGRKLQMKVRCNGDVENANNSFKIKSLNCDFID